MKIIIFGTGEIYKKNKDIISEDDEVIAFIDNNKQLQGTKCDGIEIYSPEAVRHLPYEKIVIMSMYFIEMRDQLVQLGCERNRILFYTEYTAQQSAGHLSVYYGKNFRHAGKRCLIITNQLGYHGGAIVAAYAALELQSRGYETVVASMEENRKFMNEFGRAGITFLVYPNLQFAKWDELFWVNNFDKVIVNTYTMMLCAIEIAKHRGVAFWLHENDIAYPCMDFWKDIILESLSMPALRMYAVSSVARENFYHNVEKCNIELMPYGIPDVNKAAIKSNQTLSFALIGTIQPIKQQMLFLKAVRLLNKLYSNCDFFIVGGNREGDADYARRVINEAESFPNVHITGELTRKELESIYSQIDIVVVPSSQEAMSLVATEILMYGKVCIISDIAGMAEYVQHGENGLIFKSNDVDDLVKQMSYCIENRGKLQELGKNARRIYEQYFSMEVFGDRLEQILDGQGL